MNSLYKTLNLKPTEFVPNPFYTDTVTAVMPSVLDSITTPNDFTYESGMVEVHLILIQGMIMMILVLL